MRASNSHSSHAAAPSSDSNGAPPPPPPSSSSTSASASSRRFAEIPLNELPEVMSVAKDSLDVHAETDGWTQVLDAVGQTREERQRERREWQARLDALTSQLEQLRATHPRASWRTPQAHEHQLAAYGQRTLDLAKQIAKVEAAISRAENDARECREHLDVLDATEVGVPIKGACGEEEGQVGVGAAWTGEDEEDGMKKTTVALTMFRRLGFQPKMESVRIKSDDGDDGGGETSNNDDDDDDDDDDKSLNIPTLFVRSDARNAVTPFKIEAASWEAMSMQQRVDMVNEMWDAVE